MDPSKLKPDNELKRIFGAQTVKEVMRDADEMPRASCVSAPALIVASVMVSSRSMCLYLHVIACLSLMMNLCKAG